MYCSGKTSTCGNIADDYVTLDGEQIGFPDHMERSVPAWDDMVAAAKTGAMRLKHFDIIAWDFTVNDHGQVVCIEYNLFYPGTQLFSVRARSVCR